MQRHIDYVHFNPVKHGLVERAADWPYSTFHRYVAESMLAQDWGVRVGFEADRFGERE